ncbi:MAG: hypothetical protein IKZ49_04810 [Alphaproteobacteria bacterium]|nr:hypothetical protein [Alphaproteobacteria bacterium]
MKGILFVLSLFLSMWYIDSASAVYALAEINTTNFIVDNEDMIISSNPGNPIKVKYDATYIRNNGNIQADIDINDKDIYIINSGIINGHFIDTGHGSITQIMNDESNMTNIDVMIDDFTIRLDNFDRAKFDDLKNMGANNFVIDSSSIVINDFRDWQNFNKNIYFQNSNTIYIKNSYTAVSGDYVKFINPGDNTNIIIEDMDNMHKSELQHTPYGVILNIVRETNYQKIFSDKRGIMLQNLRAKNPNDKLLKRMDKANNMRELKSAMNSSYRFNRSILFNPLKIINEFSLMNMNQDTDKDFGFGIQPYFIGAEDIENFGSRLYLSGEYEDVYFNFGLTLNKFKFSDKANDFEGMVYGTDLNLKTYLFDKYWGRGIAGFSISSFDADNIYVDNDIKNNPNGFSGYIGGEFGFDTEIMKDMVISPFAGFIFDSNIIMDKSENNFNLKIGSDIKYDYAIDSIKYKYGSGLSIATNGDIYLGFNMGFWSIPDTSGATFNIELLNTEDRFGYKFSIDAKTIF